MLKCKGPPTLCKSNDEIVAFMKKFIIETRVIQKEIDFTVNIKGEPTVMSDRILNYASLLDYSTTAAFIYVR